MRHLLMRPPAYIHSTRVSRLGALGGQVSVVLILVAFLGATQWSAARNVAKKENLWSLKRISVPVTPPTNAIHPNPIDAFLSAAQAGKKVTPLPRADRSTWLRRVTFDLTGLPPTLSEQEAFLQDDSPQASDRVIDRLLSNEQHGVWFARHWLDLLRYSDVDEGMPAASGIHHWRDWIISSLNQDLPYDAFVRAQICGNRAKERTVMTATGHRVDVPPRPEDLFALGFLARGASSKGNQDQQLAISAVETISSAFLGLTVGCAKCHDHFYDPILQRDFYSMKAIFDPLVLKPVELATAEQRFAHGRKVEEFESQKHELTAEIEKTIGSYRDPLYEDRLKQLPTEVQAAIRKPERLRSTAEQKIADDYYPVLRIDPPKIKEIMPKDLASAYDTLLKRLNGLKAPEALPVVYTVEEDPKRAAETNYVLTTGDPTRPRLKEPVQPGFPLGAGDADLRHGRREAFVDWLTSSDHPLFARVVVNRIWQWHFGVGLHASLNDFGSLGGAPTHPELLDWLSAEFVLHHYSMKWLHRTIVSSAAFGRASSSPSVIARENESKDPENLALWKFPLRRLEAEPIRDAMLAAAGVLDLTVGGPSYQGEGLAKGPNRRTVYLSRGYRASEDLLPDFLEAFDAEDGRAVCPARNRTVTAPQALWLMNHALVDGAASAFADRLKAESGDDLLRAVGLGFKMALGRAPTGNETSRTLSYLEGDAARLKGLGWLLFNLDEFIFPP